MWCCFSLVPKADFKLEIIFCFITNFYFLVHKVLCVEGQKAVVDEWASASGIKPWNAWRICLVGAGQGPDMYELSAFLGKTETLGRMQHAIDILG